MNDLFLLAGYCLIGLLFIGLWYSDRERSHFGLWGCGHMAMGIAAILALLTVGLRSDPGAETMIRLVITPITAIGIFSLIGGACLYTGRAFNWRHMATGIAIYWLLTLLVKEIDPAASRHITSAGLAIAMLSVVWALARGVMLEKAAAALFVLSAANAVWLVSSGGIVPNMPQTPIAYLLSLTAAICLLLAVFQRKAYELEHHNQLLTFSNQLITSLQNHTDERTLAEDALQQLIGEAPGRGALLHMLDESGAWFDLIAARGHAPAVVDVARRMPVDATLSGQAVKSRELVLTREYAAEPGAWKALIQAYANAGVIANVSVPLFVDNHPLGVLNISYPERHEFTAHELETLKSAGQVIATCLDRVRNVRDLAYRVNHDALTGLGNREALHAYVEALDIGRSDDISAMLLLDLDRFKEVNDTLGHQVGDQLLCEIAQGLREALVGQAGQAFRLGGDEFAIILPHLTDEDAGYRLSAELAAIVSERARLTTMALRIDVSTGIAFSPRHGTDSHELLRCADVAMYNAKTSGTQINVYERSRDPHSPERLKLLARIPEAIERNEFVLYYQPQLDLGNHRLVGCEALIRWQHPERGLLPPGEFIPLAEVSDVMRPLTDWVIDTAMRQARKWQDDRLPLRVALNLSARNILDPNFVPRLLATLERYGLAPGNVELELTETVLLHDPARSERVLEELNKRGFVLALDDFGTGFSSLTYLQRYPFDILKIDRSFVSGMHNDDASLAIVRSTIQLAHALGMRVVAEGVEDEQTLVILRSLDCNYAQGYFVGRPMAADRFEAWQKEAQVLRVAG